MKNSLRARWPEASGPWLHPAQASPGGANNFVFHNEIVINEIMYNHAVLSGTTNPIPPGSDEAWIELYNRSTNTVDLTGWELDGGITFQFADGQTMAPGAYLIVAKDTNALRATYPGVPIVGSFGKNLSHRGDTVILGARESIGVGVIAENKLNGRSQFIRFDRVDDRLEIGATA